MVAAQRQRHLAVFVQHHDMAADRGIVVRGAFGQWQVAVVGEGDVGTDLRPSSLTILPRSLNSAARIWVRGSAALETAVDVGRQAEQADRGHGSFVTVGRARGALAMIAPPDAIPTMR